MTEVEIVEKIVERRKSGAYGRMAVVRDFGVSDTTARKLVKLASEGYSGDESIEAPMKKIPSKQPRLNVTSITMSELRAKHDNLFIVQKAVEDLKPDQFFSNTDFITLCKFSNTGYKLATDRSEFAKYKGKAGGTIYWGHPYSIKQLKDDGVLKDV